MKEPDDAELNALLRKGRSAMPRPSQAFEARVMRAYQKRFASRAGWQQLFRLRFAVPLPIGVLSVVTLLAIGFAMGAKFRFSRGEIAQKSASDSKSIPANVNPTNDEDRILGGLQVVAELRPRIVGGANEGR